MSTNNDEMSPTRQRIREQVDRAVPPEWRYRSDVCMPHIVGVLVDLVEEQRQRIEALEAKLAAAATAGPPPMTEYRQPAGTAPRTPSGYWR